LDAVEKLWLNAVWGRDSIAAVLRIRRFAMMGRLNEPEQFFYAFRLESQYLFSGTLCLRDLYRG
jgi:hypothetical protein